MTTELTILRSSWWKLWPSFVAVICGQLLGTLLARWLPFHFAMGIGGFVGWFVGGLIFARRSPPKYGIPGWVVALFAGAAAGLSVGVLWFFFP